MPELVEDHSSVLLDETDIDYYDDYVVLFHFSSGRDWEPEETVEEKENGTKVRKSTVNMTPSPHVGIYQKEGKLHAIIHLPMGNPIIMDHMKQEENETDESFLECLVRSLDKGYEGIEELYKFESQNYEIGEKVQNSLESETPDNVTLVQ